VTDLGRPEPSSFVDRACACGAKILTRMETDFGISHADQDLWPAVFRQRNAGHVRATRRFCDITDFVKYDSFSGRPDLLIPGLDTSGVKIKPAIKSYFQKKYDVNTLLRATLPAKKSSYCPEDVREFVWRASRAGGHAKSRDAAAAPAFLDRLDYPEILGWAFVDDVEGSINIEEFLELCHQIGSALIGDLHLDRDMGVVAEHCSEFQHFADRIRKKALTCKGRKEFDAWFKNVREHGYVRLLDGGGCANRERAAAIKLAKTFSRVLLWFSYRAMAWNYGALMLVVWLDFCDSRSIVPDDLEQLIFRRMHAPQYYFAGLPVTFFGPSQVNFIARPLLACWGTETLLDSEAYCPLAQMLGLYGICNAERRSADRDEKKPGGRAQCNAEDAEVAPEAKDFDATDSLPMLSSKYCPVCGKRLRTDKILSEQKNGIVAVSFFCPRCDKYSPYRVSLSNVSTL
jgi:hypothetical protein